MELSSIKHIDPSQIADYKADLFIAGLGFESRSTRVARKFEGHSCRKIVLEKKNMVKDYSYQDNVSYLKAHDFEFIRVATEVPDLDVIFESFSGASTRDDTLNIVIDCTNMSPLWYYEFFSWFNRRTSMEGRVRMRIAYTMAGYVRKSGSHKVKKIHDFLKADTKSSHFRLLSARAVTASISSFIMAIYMADNPEKLKIILAVLTDCPETE